MAVHAYIPVLVDLRTTLMSTTGRELGIVARADRYICRKDGW